MGIDYGAKRVGVALTDESGAFALPFDTIANVPQLLSAIEEIIREKNVSEVVIGKSVDYKGAPNPIMADIERFAEKLRATTSVPVHFESEVLTTQEARRLQGGNAKVDASAAALILQSFIDKRK